MICDALALAVGGFLVLLRRELVVRREERLSMGDEGELVWAGFLILFFSLLTFFWFTYKVQ